MNVGCCSWSLGWDVDCEKAIQTLGELGFKGIELILRSEEELKNYYTTERIKKIVKLYESYGLAVSQFVVLNSLLEGLTSLEKTEKNHAIEIFKISAQLAKDLGTSIVNTVAHHLPGIEAPVPFLAQYIYPYVPRMKKLRPKLSMKLPSKISWDETWENYVESIGSCADIAGDEGLSLALELHTYTIVSNTDAFLRLYKEVGSKNLGINMDTGFHFAQREYLPMSIYKLKGKLLHMHIRDGDGLICYYFAPGFGIVDWEGVVNALRDIGYDGFLSIELDLHEDETIKYIERGKEYLENILKKQQGR